MDDHRGQPWRPRVVRGARGVLRRGDGTAPALCAWDAIEYFSSPAGTELLIAEAGGLSIPAVEAAARTDEWKNYAGTNGQVFLDALVDAFSDVMSGNSTVDEAIDRAAEEVNQIPADM